MPQIIIVVAIVLIVAQLIFGGDQGRDKTVNYADEARAVRLNDTDHPEFLKAMDEAGIAYRINHEGAVVYKITDIAEVSTIERRIVSGPELRPEVYELIIYSGDKERETIVNKLNRQGIQHFIEEDDTYPSIGYINYSQIHGPKVDLIKQEIAEMGFEEKMDRLKEFLNDA